MDECERCGRCCSHLRVRESEAGLTLFPDEIRFFPPDTVRPHLAKGVESPTTVFTYQHTENVCVHLKDNICSIYEDRPLMCRSFPVKVGENGLRFAAGCKAVLNTLKKHKAMNYEQPEVKAAISMAERLYEFHKNFTSGDKKWKYNLTSEQWKIMKL